MEEEALNEMEIRTLPSLSDDSERLVELHGRWLELTRGRGRSVPEPAFREAAAALYTEIEAHRAELFGVNAALQAEATLDENRFEANADAIKFCTVVLGEVNAALGRTSVPAPTR